MIPAGRTFAGMLALSALLSAAPSIVRAAPEGNAGSPGPAIRFEEETLALGEVIRGREAEAEFVYHNLGDRPLHILKAKPG